MTDKYDDCQSCAFSGQGHAICDECDDADQWEPYYDDSMDMIAGGRVIKFKKKQRIKEELESDFGVAA